jgi:hypothetical protein
MDVQQLHARGRPLRAALHAQLEGEQQHCGVGSASARPDAARRALSGGDARAADSNPPGSSAARPCLTGRGEGIGAQQPWAYGPRIRNNGSCGARLLQRERHSARPARLPSGTSTVEHAHQCPLALPTSVSAAGARNPGPLRSFQQLSRCPHACLDAGCHPASLAARRPCLPFLPLYPLTAAAS